MAEVTARLGAGTRVELQARQLTWSGDEPVAAGGTDEGPTPYELLLGSLAACIALTLRVYTTHKGIDLDGVDVTLEFDRIHADDCLECDDATDGLIERIQTRIAIHGSFDDAQKKRLTQVASRCPVHKSLAHGVRIFDTVVFG